MDNSEAAPRNRRRAWYVTAGVLVVVHGLIHLMGVVLLLELGEPGDLTYAAARPEPGTALGIGFAALWALATVLFVWAGFQLIRGGRWSALIVVASVISLFAIGAMVTAAPIGAVISGSTLVIGLWCLNRERTDR